MFDRFRGQKQITLWDGFPELMLGLWYEMDARSSFEKYCEKSELKIQQPLNSREERQSTLYLPEHANRQIVGNLLFFSCPDLYVCCNVQIYHIL